MRHVRIAVALVAILFPALAHARDAAELQLALKKLTVVGSALHIAAHPDDENTALLSYFASEKLVRAGYLSVTRGDGGQNLVGQEKGELLGVIRTEELLAARRIDGAEQFFTRAIDFGYTKSPDETLKIWDHDKVLADVVWIIRKFQPDVITTRFPTTGEGGHGQHTASAILAKEAFDAAGDPTRFPEQLRWVGLWKPRRLYWNRFSRGPVDPNAPELKSAVRIDLGTFNPLLGRAYTEIAAQSRSMHKSQGFGAAERRGSIINYFTHMAGEASPELNDLFAGIDTSWSRYEGGEAVGKLLQQAYDTFDPKNPQKTLPLLMRSWDELQRLAAKYAATRSMPPALQAKFAEISDAIRDCAGISIDVSAADSAVVPGQEINVAVTVVNRSDFPFTLSTVASPIANPGKAPGTPLKNNQPVRTEISLKIPTHYNYSQPYWLRKAPEKGTYTVEDERDIGRPENAMQLPITVALDVPNEMRSFIFTVPAIFRWTDAVRGEQVRDVDIVPDVVANFGSRLYIFPDTKPRPVSVWMRSFGAKSGTVRLIAPQGWKVEPASVAVTFEGKGDEKTASFSVTPPAGETSADLVAQIELPDGKKLALGLTTIDHEHIPAQRIFGDAAARLLRADIKRAGSRIGYIMGAGDEIPDLLRQVGYDVALIEDSALDSGDFARYDAIVTGVRAYNNRPRLKLAHAKLMKYVENGGTLVVQMNSLSPQRLLVDSPGPYPIKIGNERVTVEESPVTVLKAGHPLLNTPNKIGAGAWNDWVQERGLYFPETWDAKYDAVVAMNDPGETPKNGAVLYAKHGKGAFVYTPIAFFRQLPAGVGGAYKLFVNLVSAQ
jgi:LmbE family N-acetylglucosaminyl deacetylase